MSRRLYYQFITHYELNTSNGFCTELKTEAKGKLSLFITINLCRQPVLYILYVPRFFYCPNVPCPTVPTLIGLIKIY